MWREYENKLVKTFEFIDFDAAWSFMEQAAPLFVRFDHHPKWTNDYNTVTFELQTHTAGNKVTDKDWALADAIDKLID